MSRNGKFMRLCISGCGLVLLAGMIVYAGEPSSGPKASVPVPVLTNAFSYQGPGIMVERVPLSFAGTPTATPSVLAFSPGDTMRSETIGFDLRWDKETIRAARAGELELIRGVGWLDIEYDTETGILDIQVTEEGGDVFQVAYVLNPDSIVEESAFLAHVERFFEYMHSPALTQRGGGFQAIGGGSCTANNADGTVCCTAGPCPRGTMANCHSSGSGCVCACAGGTAQ